MSNLYNFLTDDTMKIPPCITVMDPDLLEYVPGQHLTLSFPVKNFYLNGGNVMPVSYTHLDVYKRQW